MSKRGRRTSPHPQPRNRRGGGKEEPKALVTPSCEPSGNQFEAMSDEEMAAELSIFEELMDGARFPVSYAGKNVDDKFPRDFITDPATGRRPGETKEPWGMTLTNLRNGIKDFTLPPRSIWNEGKWKTERVDERVWVVSGEGTPGNYKDRHYELPDDALVFDVPDHPSDWPIELRMPPTKTTGYGVPTGSSSYVKRDTGPSLPAGLRVRCMGCGHFFRMDDLGTHAKNACPATQGDGPALWVIKCECHTDLLQTATVLDGFPFKPQFEPQAAAAETSESTNEGDAGEDSAPDESGGDGDEKKEVVTVADEAGGGSGPGSAEGAAA